MPGPGKFLSLRAFSMPRLQEVIPMNKKCPNCGFINFQVDGVCRKCESALDELSPTEVSSGPWSNPYATTSRQQQPTGGKRVKILSSILVGLVVLSMLAGSAAVFRKRKSEIKWREFHGNGANLVVMMPKEPRAIEPEVTPLATGTITNHSYVALIAGQGSVTYTFVDYSFDLGSSEKQHQRMLEAELADLIKRTDSTLLNRANLNVNGFPGVQFEMNPPIDLSRENGKSVGRMFFAKNRLYLLTLTANTDSELFKGRDMFLNVNVPES